ncbi:MAG: protoporphyrinogen oxidase [Verrucomicrobiota bacterium]
MEGDAIIIGGGLSGLAAGWHRQRRGEQVQVLDRQDNPGGVVQTVELQGYRVEAGPNTLMLNDRRVMELIEQVGLTDRMLEAAPDAAKRFLVKDGDVIAAPLSPLQLWQTTLFSKAAKLQLLHEPLQGKHDGRGEESLADFIRRRLGDEWLDQAVQPIVSGVYAGDPEKLSVRHAMPSLYQLEQDAGSLLLGGILKLFRPAPNRMKRKLISFRHGIGELPRALGEKLGQSYAGGVEITQLSQTGSGWKACWRCDHGNGEEREMEARELVLAIPAYALATLPLAPELRKELLCLAEIPYAPVNVVALGFDRSQVKHPLDGFGMLIPDREGQPVLGSLFSSTLFPARAPDGKVLLTSFVGGRLHSERAAAVDRDLVDLVMSSLRDLLGVTGDPEFQHMVRWERAIPQLELGHGQFLDRIARLEQRWHGLHITGNFRHGISASQCLLAGC